MKLDWRGDDDILGLGGQVSDFDLSPKSDGKTSVFEAGVRGKMAR